MNIGLLGFGTIGSSFYRLTLNQEGFCVKTLLSRREREGLSCQVVYSFDEILNDPEIDTVVELIGGMHPAFDYICAALNAKKHVVTANKMVVCAHYKELIALAEQNGVCLRCTAAAGGGIPWLPSINRAAAMDRLDAVEGILNGTTNYMLSEMTARGADYSELLREAQELGYAEADPTDDVEGFDTRRKLVLSANLAFDISVNEQDVPCEGISTLSSEDIAWAKERNLVFKLIARAERHGSGISAYVCPTLFPSATTEAQTNDIYNLVSLYAEHIGKQSFFGAGAGDYPTASNVLADCMEIKRGCPPFYNDRPLDDCGIDNAGTEGPWLFRANGTYTVRCLSVANAFYVLSKLRGIDSTALLAKLPYTVEV